MNQTAAKVMIVEDEILIGLMLAKKLRGHGFDVGDIITSGEQAIEAVVGEKPSVILMDVTLSGEMNGIEAARLIKAEHNIPVIIFTGYTDSQLREQAQKVQPVAVLTKMAPVSDIVSAINQVVKP